ncbi:hypothetical protein EDB89DRAFT_1913864 [Lactarius sanguifluus]|nr:hypothetical protein EDB89DRAFT_1913864 [Lactarius sanguifluus]
MNATQARQKKNHRHIEPVTPDGNNAARPTSPSLEGSMDLGHEGDRGGHDGDTTQALQGAEKQAEQSIKCQRAPHFPGKSERTLSRERLAWRKLAAKGFTTLPDFFRQNVEKEDWQARLNALVAAAAASWCRSMQQRQEEEEEEGEGEAEASRDDTIAAGMPCIFKITSHSEPIQVDNTAKVLSMPQASPSQGSSSLKRARIRREQQQLQDAE